MQPQILENVVIDDGCGGYLLATIHINDGIINQIDTLGVFNSFLHQSRFYVTCGFVNSHIHPNQLLDRRLLDGLDTSNLLSGMHIQKNKTDDDRYAQAVFVLIDALKNGATSMYAVASNPMPVIKAFQDLDLSGAVSCFFNDTWEGKGNAPKKTGLEDIEKTFLSFYQHNSNNLKIHIGAGSVLSASDQLLVLFNRIAEKYNTKICIHISEGEESVDQCLRKRGSTPVRHLHSLGVLNKNWNLIHATNIDQEEIDIISRSGASVIHCPVSNAKTGVGIAPIIDLAKEGVIVGLGTDACSNNNTNNILNEAYFATLLHGAFYKDPIILPIEKVLQWMAINGFKIMGLPRSGALEIGERADLLLWDLKSSPFVPVSYGKFNSVLVYNAPDIKPHSVFLRGLKVLENYQFIAPLEEKAILLINQITAMDDA